MCDSNPDALFLFPPLSHPSNPSSHSAAMKLLSVAALLSAIASAVNAMMINTP